MIKRYSKATVRKLLRRHEADIQEAATAYGIPKACIQAVLWQEMTGMDWLDPLADLAVACYWRFQPLWDRMHLPAKRDSSTGYGQIFAATAIKDINYAHDAGIRALPVSARFNIQCVALCLLHAAAEMTGTTDFSALSPEELQLVFTRYNADTKKITPYGKETYGYYQTFQGGSL